MIKLHDYTPEIYYKESRDFQFIGRLYDLVLNYLKTNVDLLYYLPMSINSDDQFIELMAYTLGFKQKHNYTAKHLRAVCSVFSEILRNKGTIKSVLLACSAIFQSEGIEQEVSYELKNNNTTLVLYLPPQLKDTTLLNDLFDYILPAGMACNIIKLVQINSDAGTKIDIKDSFKLFDSGDYNTKTYTDPNKKYLYDNNIMSVIPQYINSEDTDRTAGIVNTGDAIRALAKDTLGILANSAVYVPEENTSNTEPQISDTDNTNNGD